MQREHGVAISLVHHMSKKSRAQLGQALRGSSDLFAWADSNVYLVRRQSSLRLSVEHRAAAAGDPFDVALVTGDDGDTHLQVASDPNDQHAAKTPLTETIRRALLHAGGPLTRRALRQELRVNNQRLGDALLHLERQGLIQRTGQGWLPQVVVTKDDRLPDREIQLNKDDGQLQLI